MITEAHGCPLAVSLTGGNSNDVTQLIPHPGHPARAGPLRPPPRRLEAIDAAHAYDHDKYHHLSASPDQPLIMLEAPKARRSTGRRDRTP